VGVDGHRTLQLGGHQLGHEGDPRRAADEQHPVEVAGRDPGAVHGAAQGGDGLPERPADELLQLRPGQAHLGAHRGQDHRDGRLGVAGQRLLGLGALAPQPGQVGDDRGVVAVELGDRVADEPQHVAEDRLVDVDATEPLDALRPAEHGEDAVVGAAQHGGVEGAAAEVVHREDGARLQPLRRGVVVGGGHRLGQQPGAGDAGAAGRGGQQVELVRPPARRVAHHQPVRRPALATGDGTDRPLQDAAHQQVGGERGPTQQQRCGVAEAALELPRHPVGFGHGAAHGRLPDQDVAAGVDVHDRRHHRTVVAQADDVRPPVPQDRGGGERRPHVDTQLVAPHPGRVARRCPAWRR
jgi:hypothetical protein